MLLQERLLDLEVTFSDLSKHPTDHLVDQVFFVPQKSFGKLERLFELSQLDVSERGHDGNAAFPHVLRSRPLVQYPSAAILKRRADDQVGGTVDQIPVVHEPHVLAIQIKNSLAD